MQASWNPPAKNREFLLIYVDIRLFKCGYRTSKESVLYHHIIIACNCISWKKASKEPQAIKRVAAECGSGCARVALSGGFRDFGVKHDAIGYRHSMTFLHGERFFLTFTGTPVENRLTELFSLFEFLNPGFLGSKDWKWIVAMSFDMWAALNQVEECVPTQLEHLKFENSFGVETMVNGDDNLEVFVTSS